MRKYKEIGLKLVSHSLILAVKIMRLSIFILSDINRYVCSMQEMIFDYDIEDENTLNMIETNFEKCVAIVKALHNMVEDNFNKDDLPPFYELACTKQFLGGLT